MAEWLLLDVGTWFLAGTVKRLSDGAGQWWPVALTLLLLVFLGNIQGYPYRELGDSIVWKGQLQNSGSGSVWLDLSLRTVLITEDSLNVAGTAELWLAP